MSMIVHRKSHIGTAAAVIGIAGTYFWFAPNCSGREHEEPAAQRSTPDTSLNRRHSSDAQAHYPDLHQSPSNALYDALTLRRDLALQPRSAWSDEISASMQSRPTNERFSYRLVSLADDQLAVQFISKDCRTTIERTSQGDLERRRTTLRNVLLLLDIEHAEARDFIRRVVDAEDPMGVRSTCLSATLPIWARRPNGTWLPFLVESITQERRDSNATVLSSGTTLHELWSYGVRLDAPDLPSKRSISRNSTAPQQQYALQLEWAGDDPNFSLRLGTLPGRILVSPRQTEIVWFAKQSHPGEDVEVEYLAVAQLVRDQSTQKFFTISPDGQMEESTKSYRDYGLALPDLEALTAQGLFDANIETP